MNGTMSVETNQKPIAGFNIKDLTAYIKQLVKKDFVFILFEIRNKLFPIIKGKDLLLGGFVVINTKGDMAAPAGIEPALQS